MQQRAKLRAMVKKGRLETVERDRLRDDLDSMSEAQLERLHAGLMRLAELSPKELQALMASLLADEADA